MRFWSGIARFGHAITMVPGFFGDQSQRLTQHLFDFLCEQQAWKQGLEDGMDIGVIDTR